MRKWLKFFTGLALLALMGIFFGSGYTPPGILGEVIRHNQVNNIDASPLLYSEVENMSELEDGVRCLRAKRSLMNAKNKADKTARLKRSRIKR